MSGQSVRMVYRRELSALLNRLYCWSAKSIGAGRVQKFNPLQTFGKVEEMTLEELLAMEEVEDWGAWRGDVANAYQNVSAGYNAKVEELEASVADWKKKYEETAAHNYELMRAVTSEKKDEDHTDSELHATEDELGEEDKKFDDLLEDKE